MRITSFRRVEGITSSMRPWVSEKAISYGPMTCPELIRSETVVGTRSRSIRTPSAISAAATARPPEEISSARLTNCIRSRRRINRTSARAASGSPICEVYVSLSPRLDCRFVSARPADADKPPPRPSRPVLAPTRTITSPGIGRSDRYPCAGAAAAEKQTSMCFAEKSGWRYSLTYPVGIPLWTPNAENPSAASNPRRSAAA